MNRSLHPLNLIPAMACALIVLAGCAGNGQGLDQGGRPLAPGGSGNGALTADFDSIQSHVFTPICTACHAGSNAPQGLHLDAGNSYAQLVGVPSSEVPALLRVKPGDPDNSYIVQKLEGHAAIGAQMPFGGPPLPAATIAVIRQWITDGALASPTPTAAARFAVLSAFPATGDSLAAPPARIIIAFNQELDQTRIDAASVHLEATPATVPAATGLAATELVEVTATVARGNPRALILEPRAPLAADRHYRVVVGGLTGSALASIGGEQLSDGADARDAGIVVSEFDVASAP